MQVKDGTYFIVVGVGMILLTLWNVVDYWLTTLR